MLLHFLGVASVSVALLRVPRTRSLVPALKGTHVGVFLARAALPALHRGEEGVWCGGRGSGSSPAP